MSDDDPPDATGPDDGGGEDGVDDVREEDAGSDDTRAADDGSPDPEPANADAPDSTPADSGAPDSTPADSGAPDSTPADDGPTDSGAGPDGSADEITAADLAVGIPLVLGGIAWIADGFLGVTEFAVGGATVRTGALAIGLVAAGFLAHAVERALADELVVAGVVAAFAVGLAVANVGRTGADGTIQLAGTALMVLGVAAYAYLTFRSPASGGS